MNLTADFTLEEMLRSANARRDNITEQYAPDQNIIDNLKNLAEHILEPLRKAINAPITISSGYRCPRLNALTTGSSGTSQHMEGKAADCEWIVGGKNNNLNLAKEVLKLGLPFDQMILEYGTFDEPAWIHLSYDAARERGMILLKDETHNYTPLLAEEILNR